jgi:regulatory protein
VENSQALSQKAKEYAFLLLKFRQRSEKEVYQRLKKKKFPEQAIKETVIFLKDKHFIDDNLFARAWIESRLKKPLGIRKIREELRIKGIDEQIIDDNLNEVMQGYSEEGSVLKIAKEKLSKSRNIEPQKAKRRVYSYLLRRGFSPEIVIDVLNQICKQIP